MLPKQDIKKIKDFIKKHNIQRMRLMFPDLTWKPRGKIVPTRHFLNHLDGIQFPEEIASMAITGDVIYQPGTVSGFESNMVGHPDVRTLTLTPWMENTAQVIMKLSTQEGKPFGRDPRDALETVFNRFAKKGMLPRIGVEVECYLFKDGKPATKGFESDRIEGLSDVDDFIQRVLSYAKIMGIDINTFHHETAPGQVEMALQHKFALRAADELFYFKELLVEAGKQLGYTVSLMPRVSRDLSPSGSHLHLSIQDKKGKNLFASKGKETQLMKHALGGILKYLDAGCAFYLPTANSYKRIDPTQWTPINKSWAHDNRFVSIRVTNQNDKSKNIENRVCGIDINPHLAIAAYMVSAFLGITHKIKPHKESQGSPYKDTSLSPLPRDLLMSLELLQEDKEFIKTLSSEIVNLYIALKQIEHKEYSLTITPWETEQYGP